MQSPEFKPLSQRERDRRKKREKRKEEKTLVRWAETTSYTCVTQPRCWPRPPGRLA
jgi:hypothetical protein